VKWKGGETARILDEKILPADAAEERKCSWLTDAV
jgi:hypothetical protein